MLNFAALTPHPLVLIPQIKTTAKALLPKTKKAFSLLATDFRRAAPETIVMISARGPIRYDKFTINFENSFKGNFRDFDGEDYDYIFRNDYELSRRLLRHLRREHAPIDIIRETALDYGSLIPLTYLTNNLDYRPNLILLTYTAADWEAQYKFGQQIGKILHKEEKSIALIASVNLSNRLSEKSPAGFSPYGAKYDSTLIKLLQENDVEKIKALNPEFCEEAGEEGLQAILIALGALSFTRYAFQQLSYENSLGTGYLVGEWNIK